MSSAGTQPPNPTSEGAAAPFPNKLQSPTQDFNSAEGYTSNERKLYERDNAAATVGIRSHLTSEEVETTPGQQATVKVIHKQLNETGLVVQAD
jgi:hypothetical protein